MGQGCRGTRSCSPFIGRAVYFDLSVQCSDEAPPCGKRTRECRKRQGCRGDGRRTDALGAVRREGLQRALHEAGLTVDSRPLMPVERKPLFRSEVLAPRAAAMVLDAAADQARDLLRKWARLLASPRAEELTESELLPDFLTDVFYGVLGYRGPAAAGERHTLSREKRVEVDGESVDAVLGEF